MAHWLLVLALTAAHNGYAAAYRRAEAGGVPMVILIGADWCGACTATKTTIGKIDPKLHGQIAYGYIDVDKHSKLAKNLSGGGPIPQLIAFWRTKAGWIRSVFVGSHTVKTTEAVLQGWINKAAVAGKALPKDE